MTTMKGTTTSTSTSIRLDTGCIPGPPRSPTTAPVRVGISASTTAGTGVGDGRTTTGATGVRGTGPAAATAGLLGTLGVHRTPADVTTAMRIPIVTAGPVPRAARDDSATARGAETGTGPRCPTPPAPCTALRRGPAKPSDPQTDSGAHRDRGLAAMQREAAPLGTTGPFSRLGGRQEVTTLAAASPALARPQGIGAASQFSRAGNALPSPRDPPRSSSSPNPTTSHGKSDLPVIF